MTRDFEKRTTSDLYAGGVQNEMDGQGGLRRNSLFQESDGTISSNICRLESIIDKLRQTNAELLNTFGAVVVIDSRSQLQVADEKAEKEDIQSLVGRELKRICFDCKR